MCTLVVFYAVARGAGNHFYEALAREKDEPHRTFFVLVPYFTTLIGGLVSNILFGPVAVAGYLVTGLGDAIGEPPGTLSAGITTASSRCRASRRPGAAEGSAAVFVMCAVALWLAAALSPESTSARSGRGR